MKKVIATFALLLCLVLTSLSTIAANNNLKVKDKKGASVKIEELKKSLNYQTTIDRYSIDKLLDCFWQYRIQAFRNLIFQAPHTHYWDFMVQIFLFNILFYCGKIMSCNFSNFSKAFAFMG